MSKVLKVVGTIAGFVAMGAAIATGFGAVAIAGLSLATLGAAAGVVALGASLLAGRPRPPKASPADRTRLFASINPREPRKIIYGNTAMATDIRDEEYTGANQEYFHRFLVIAGHKIGGVHKIWFDDKLAWTLAGGVQGHFAGFLDVEIRLEGNAGNAINISPRMGSTRIFTGLAYVHFRYKLTGPNQETQSPFAQSVPTRITIIGDGMPVYDPRQDSTAGGSGAHRIDDQSTWGWADDIHRNPPLQLLNYLIGWKINGLLSVGKGIPPARIDLASFIAGANLCDEAIALAAGGTEPRYRTGGIFSESDPMDLVLDQYKSSMNATLDDVDGKIRLYVLHNDLALPIADFTEDDILGGVDWRPNIRLTDHFNIIRGSHTDPSDAALYQSVAWPEIELPSVDGIDRIETIDYPLVESDGQCQRLGNQRLQRMQYSGVFSASYQRTAWAVQKGDVIRQTFPALAFVNKLFRVIDTGAQTDGIVPMVLREENAAIYAWDASEQASVIASPADIYDYTKNPLYAEMARKIEAWAPWSGIEENRPRDIRALPDGSVWQFTGAAAAIGSFPTLTNANWTQISPPTNAPILSGIDLEEMREALAGAVFWQESAPAAAASYIGQKWVKPSTGEIYLRIGGGILLDGKVITLGGFRPSIYWTLQAAQPLAGALQSSSAAANNANAALADALAANAALADIANDNLLTPGEKPEVILKRDVILAEQAGITAEATEYAITTEKTAYTAAILALTDHLATLTSPASWSSLGGNTAIAGTTFRGKFAAVYAARQALLNAIAAAAKSLADAAQAQADIGVAAADAAQLAADTAIAAAAQANTVLSNIANDDLLTPGEKPEVILKRDVILAEQAGITAEAAAHALTSQKTAYTAAILALTDYLAALTAPVIWSSLAGNTTIAGAAFRAKFADVYAARQALLNAIAAAARARADIKGKTFIQAAAPSAAISEIGDIWISADGTYHDRVAGSILLGGKVITLGGFRPSLIWTAAAEQPQVAAAKTALWSGVNGDGTPESFADVTQTAQITIDPIAPFDIQANSSGETTSALPQSRTVKLRKGGVLITSGLSFSQNSVSGGLAITVGASSGVIDLTAAPVAGAILIDAVFAGVTYQAAILVNRTKAAAITGGAAGSSQFIDDEWSNISNSGFVQVTDLNARVQSSAAGELRYSASASYNGAGTAVIKAQYSLDGGAWSDFAAEVSGLAAVAGFEPEPGFVAIAGAIKTGLSASADYYVRLIAKRSSGTGALSWFGAGFTVKQP